MNLFFNSEYLWPRDILKLSENLKTVLIYFHMDGQPVDASKWNQKDPFVPILTENINGELILILIGV